MKFYLLVLCVVFVSIVVSYLVRTLTLDWEAAAAGTHRESVRVLTDDFQFESDYVLI